MLSLCWRYEFIIRGYIMATLTIRKLDDKVVEDFKRIAKKNNRSAEAQARSLIEDFTAGVLAHDIMSGADLVREMRELLDGEYIEGDEFDVRDRTDFGRPIEL